MVIGFSDDSLAGIISNLLTELSHWYRSLYVHYLLDIIQQISLF